MGSIDCTSIQFTNYKIPSIDKDNQSVIFPDCDIPVSISPSTLPINVVGETYDYNDNKGDLRTGYLYIITIGNNDFRLFICSKINLKCECSDISFLNQNVQGVVVEKPLRGNIPNTDLLSYIVDITISGYQYILYLPAFKDLCNNITTTYRYIILNLKKSLRSSFGANTTGPNPLRLSMKTLCRTDVPRIDISGQTLIDGSDVGNVIFTISDKYYYYDNTPIKLDNKKCDLECIPINQIKTTIFDKKCPKMVDVFIGKGKFLYHKVDNIWKTSNLAVDLPTFYENIILYGMVRYILSKILYGNFNINYLLKRYYEQFLSDLKKSRFCNFLEFFIDPTNRELFEYFKY
jgi:hypothetical protein